MKDKSWRNDKGYEEARMVLSWRIEHFKKIILEGQGF
jgi:hypothetical protein